VITVELTCSWCDHTWTVKVVKGQIQVRCPNCEQFVYTNKTFQ